ncbi:MAG: isoprenylcysteine carboxylmethyltransferase family protein, partial [Actinomycetota bacterium]|nr:isoprenylcysteine carboxylmethyltransferase family protein [Actinomycetota bacterium]
MPSDDQDKAGIVAPPPVIYLGALVCGLLLNRKFPVALLPRRIARSLGWPLVSGGVLLIGWFEWAMRNAGTPANPYKPVSHIATDGPFRYTRNPAYLSMTMIYVGIASLANALWAILLLPVALLVIQRGVIEREERYLERKFGEEYLRYKAR